MAHKFFYTLHLSVFLDPTQLGRVGKTRFIPKIFESASKPKILLSP